MALGGKPLVVALIAAALVLPSSNSVAATAKVGGSCPSINKTTTISGKQVICSKVAGKLKWVLKKIPVARPTSTPTPPPVLSIEERWRKTGSSALKAFDEAQYSSLPADHQAQFIWETHSSAIPGVLERLKADYDFNARYWSRFLSIPVPVKVLVSGYDQTVWQCERKLDWLKMNQPDCVKVETQGPGMWRAGTSQFNNKNINSYQLTDLPTMDLKSFVPRAAHEFFHNVQYSASPDYYQYVFPCWAMEGGAEYFGILLSSLGKPELFLDLRNDTLTKIGGPDGRGSFEPKDWLAWLKKTDRSGVRTNDDRCGEVRSELYAHSILATEYLAKELGVKGVIDLYKAAQAKSWNLAIEESFKKPLSDVYEEMSVHMAKEYEFAIKNPWSYQSCSTFPRPRNCG